MRNLSVIKSDLVTQSQALYEENKQLYHQIERLRTLNHKWYELYSQQIKTSMKLRTTLASVLSLERNFQKQDKKYEKLKRKYLKKCYKMNEIKKVQEQTTGEI